MNQSATVLRKRSMFVPLQLKVPVETEVELTKLAKESQTDINGVVMNVLREHKRLIEIKNLLNKI